MGSSISSATKIDLIIPAGKGRACRIAAGNQVEVINTYGTQVVDTWAFAGNLQVGEVIREFLSMPHCRDVLQKTGYSVGDTLVSNLYRPMLTILQDTSPGVHDALIPACSEAFFVHGGAAAEHPSCAHNLLAALEDQGLLLCVVPCPWNLFMNAPVGADGRIALKRPVSRPGDRISLCAEMDCLMVFSACPDDLMPTNGGDGTPRDVMVRITQPRQTDVPI